MLQERVSHTPSSCNPNAFLGRENREPGSCLSGQTHNLMDQRFMCSGPECLRERVFAGVREKGRQGRGQEGQCHNVPWPEHLWDFLAVIKYLELAVCPSRMAYRSVHSCSRKRQMGRSQPSSPLGRLAAGGVPRSLGDRIRLEVGRERMEGPTWMPQEPHQTLLQGWSPPSPCLACALPHRLQGVSWGML